MTITKTIERQADQLDRMAALIAHPDLKLGERLELSSLLREQAGALRRTVVVLLSQGVDLVPEG